MFNIKRIFVYLIVLAAIIALFRGVSFAISGDITSALILMAITFILGFATILIPDYDDDFR